MKKDLQKIIVFASMLLLLQLNGYSQATEIMQKTSLSNADYFQIKAELNNYLNTLDTTTSSKEYKIVARWSTFWQNRILLDTNTGVGSFATYSIATDKLIKGQINYTTKQANPNWQLLGPKTSAPSGFTRQEMQNIGLVSCIKPTPLFNTINYLGDTNRFLLAGSNTGGLFYKEATTNQWHYAWTGTQIPGNGIADIEIRNDIAQTTYYIATGKNRYDAPNYGGGIFKATSMTNWMPLASFPNHPYGSCSSLLLDTVGNNFYIYAIVDDVVFRSDNDGTSWTEIFSLPNAQKRIINEIHMKPDDPNTLYISTTGSNDGLSYYTAQVWYTNQARTAQSTSNWTLFNFGTAFTSRIALDVSEALPNALWLMYFDTARHVTVLKFDTLSSQADTLVYKQLTKNQATDYSTKFAGIGKYRCEIEVSNLYPDTFFVGGYYVTRVIYDSINGNHYHMVNGSKEFHVDVRSLHLFKDLNGIEHLFAGNDGGISYSNDYGQTWESINGTGLAITQFYGIGGLENNPNKFAAGSIDNGLFGILNDSLIRFLRSDVYDVVYNTKIENTIYCHIAGITDIGWVIVPRVVFDDCVQGYIKDSLSRIQLRSAILEGSLYDCPIVANPNNPNEVFYGYKNIYKLTDHPENNHNLTFQKQFDILSLDSNLEKVRSIKFAPSDPNTIYIAYNGPTWNDTTGKSHNKLWKSTDGGNTWINMHQYINQMVKYNPIRDIAISPNDPNKVWIAMGYFGDAALVGNTNRVYYSEDGGYTWRDYSLGLTAYPINSIECVQANDMNELYVATDIGVFYNNKVDTVWKRLGSTNDMPYFICTDLEINYGAKQLMVSTYGNGIWKADISIACGSTSKTITSNVVWNQEVYFANDIIIDSAASLTIKGILYMDQGATITIKKGGELIVDGGKISSRCGMWQGIVVEGDPNLPQFPVANQAWLRLKNNAIIENAIAGVHIISPPNSPTAPYNPKGGGVIRIDNAKFVNNVYGIIMEKYSDVTPSGFIKANLSHISNTKFETSDTLIDTLTFPNPIAFIKLNNVHKLFISGCEFSNTYANNFYNQNHGTAIDAFNSSFKILNGINGDTTVFSNLQRGIKAYAMQANISADVVGAAFNNTTDALYMNGVYAPRIVNCSFNMENTYGYGLYLDNCTHYTIEQNAFNGPSNGLLSLAAMVINNSGSDANEVYNNYFQNFPAAMLAQHDNRGGKYYNGLQIKCNDFNNCMQDIAITENYNYTGKTGISAFQGSKANNKSPAGNTFSHKGYSTYFGNNPYSDYNNEKGEPIVYVHHNGTASDPWLPIYFTYSDPTTGNNLPVTQIVSSDTTAAFQYTKSISCENRQNTGSGSSIIVLYDSINAQQVQLNSAKLTLSIYEDGGNPELNEEVATAYPWETWQYYNELMLASPYLSDETLIEAINNTDLLPTNLLKLILLANPQCSRSEEVMDMLYARIPAMSQADIDQILQKQGDSSPIDELKANVNYYTHERMRYATQIENSYLKDTINDYAMDSLINFLGRENNVNAKYRLAFLYYHKGEYDLMNNTLSDIDANFELTERQAEEKADFISYFSIMQSMAENDLIFDELSVGQKQSIQSLSSGIYLPGAYARSMLLQYDNTFSYTEPVIFPTITSSRLHSYFDDNKKESLIKVYPNPAYNYISVDYKLDNGTAHIEIIDNIGRLLISKSINNLQGTEVIGLDILSPGMYQLLFYNNNKLIETVQFSKVK